jgi:3-methylcrotonyl-CoA carboxylase alpha subunit
MNKNISLGELETSIAIDKLSSSEINFSYQGEIFNARLISKNNDELILNVNGQEFIVSVTDFENKGLKQVFTRGFEEYIKLHPKAVGSSHKAAAAGSLESPMPGKIFKVLKRIGDNVKVGDTILILEAMKMEHTIKATKDGKIEEIFFKEGEQVTGGAVLCAIE